MNLVSSKISNPNILKLAIIPVLVSILGYVVWSNQSKTQTAATTAPGATPVTPAATAAVVSESTAASSMPAAVKAKRIAWPKFTTEQILATNPFRGSTAMRTALKPAAEMTVAVDQSDKAATLDVDEAIDPWAGLAESFDGKSSAVFLESSKGSILKVGEKNLKAGDRIDQRFRVKEIRPDGVIIEASPAMK